MSRVSLDFALNALLAAIECSLIRSNDPLEAMNAAAQARVACRSDSLSMERPKTNANFRKRLPINAPPTLANSSEYANWSNRTSWWTMTLSFGVGGNLAMDLISSVFDLISSVFSPSFLMHPVVLRV